VYWCCAQIEQCRDRLAWHCLTLAGYKVYQPLLREPRRSHGRKIIATPPLFIWVVRGWWDARWAASVRGEAVIGRLLQDELKSLAAGARKAAEYYRANPDKISRDADLRGPARSSPLPLVCAPRWSCVQTCLVPSIVPLPAPFLFGLPLHRRRCGIFHLDPVARAPGAVGWPRRFDTMPSSPSLQA
jgi:hypothetical protein